MTTDAATATCFYCKETDPGHGHFAVLVRENGRLLGRLTPKGGVTNRNIFAWILNRSRADEITAQINAGDAGGEFTAKTIPF